MLSIAVFSPIAGPRGEGGSPECVTSSTIWYVDADAPGLRDGLNWEDAFLSPHGALAVAAEGDEIRVARGTYHSEPPDGNRQVFFRLVGGVALRGGFAGYGEEDPDERDVARFRTILSGDLNDDDPIIGPFNPFSEERSENSVHVLVGDRLGQGTILDGLTITGGNAGSGRGAGLEGGGMRIEFAVVTIRDCTFVRNFATTEGGGIRLVGGGNLSVVDCRFIDNVIEIGGGAISTDAHIDLAVRRSFFWKNGQFRSGGSFGGAIHTIDGSELTLEDCVFTGNEALYGGAISFRGFSFRATNCVVRNNEARSSGGGMQASARVHLVLVNCQFTGNRARFGVGATVSSEGEPSAEITNCTFSRNVSTGDVGAPLFLDLGWNLITNSIFYGNIFDGMGGEDAQIGFQGSTTVEVNYSTVERWTGRFDGWGTADLDPAFVDAEGGDFRLSPGSPIIDAGDNSAVPLGLEFDVEGNPRFVDDPMTDDTGIQNCPSVDLGAYEFQAEGGCCARRPRWVCDADADGDGQVNPVDSGLVQAAFGATSEQDLCNYDLDCDGQVNPVDAGIVQSLFGTCEAPREACP